MKIVAVFILVVTCVEMRVGAQDTPQNDGKQLSPEQIFWRAREVQIKGKHDLAVKLFSEAIKRKPDYADALQSRAVSWAFLKELDRVIEDCTEALRINPAMPRLYMLRATAYDASGDHHSALKDLSDLILLGTGDNLHPRAQRALVYIKLGYREAAIKDLESEIDRLPELLPKLGTLLVEESHFPSAAKCYTLAIHRRLQEIATERNFDAHLGKMESYTYGAPDYTGTIVDADAKVAFKRSDFEARMLTLIERFTAPTYIDTGLAKLYYGRGDCLLAANALDHAAVDFTDGMKFCATGSPEHEYGLSLLLKVKSKSGAVQFQPGKEEEAIAALSAVMEKGKVSVETLRARGDASMQAGKYQDAINDYEEACRLNPTDATTFRSCATAFIAVNQSDKALVAYDRLLELSPDRAEDFEQRGNLLQSKGETERAASDYFDALRIGSKEFTTLRGVVRDRSRNDEQSLAECNARIASGRHVLIALVDRASVYNSMGNYNSAITDLLRVRKEAPEAREPMRDLAEAYLGLNEYDKAIRIYTEALSMDVSTELYLNLRAKAHYENKAYVKAIREYEKTIERYPKEADAYVQLAYLYVRCPDENFRNAEKAWDLVKQCRKLNSFGATSYLERAAIYAANGDYEHAILWQYNVMDGTGKDHVRDAAKQLAEYMAQTKDAELSWPMKRVRGE